MGPKENASARWYEKTWVVILLCLFFFPFGIYALWKNSTIGSGWKICITVIIALVLIAKISDKNETSIDTPAVEEQTRAQSESSYSLPAEPAVQEEAVDEEKQEIIERLKIKARQDWPNDYMTQEYWVNQELEDFEYMRTIESNPIKKQAQRDWPLDFSTQKYWYNEQVEAKERMK